MERIKIIHAWCFATFFAGRKSLSALAYSRMADFTPCCKGAAESTGVVSRKKLSRVLVLPLDQTNPAAIDSQPIEQVTSHPQAGPGGFHPLTAAHAERTAQTQPPRQTPAASGNGDISLAYQGRATSLNRRTSAGWAHSVCAASASSVRARRALHRASSFGSLLAFLLIDFSRYFFDQGDSHPVPVRQS